MKFRLSYINGMKLAAFVLMLVTISKTQLAFARGASEKNMIPDGVYAGLGYLNFNSGVASSSATSGTKPFLYQTYTMISLAGYFKVKDQWSISPRLDFTLIGRKSPEGKEKSSVTVIGARAFRPLFTPGFNLHVGPGLIIYRMEGSGGTTELNNGSSTATFGIPSETRASNSIFWDIGAGYQKNRYRFELSLLVTDIFKSSKQALTPVLTASTEIF